MRYVKIIFLAVWMLLTATDRASAQSEHGNGPEATAGNPSKVADKTEFDLAIDRITSREHDEGVMIDLSRPIIETYIQEVKPDKQMGTVVRNDDYFLGQANFEKGIIVHSMLSKNKISDKLGTSMGMWNPNGFLQMVFVDRKGFDRQHYKFEYSGREFLGEVRCLMFDVIPLPKSGRGRFGGRIWVEEQGYTIVRFNGSYMPLSGGFLTAKPNVHFDSWRCNVQPELWVPCYIFSQEVDMKQTIPGRHLRFNAQARLWGYNLQNAHHQEEFSELTIEAAEPVHDEGASEHHDRSPVAAEREWRRQAERNALDALERTGLVAPEGEVDKVLETVVNNLVVTNNLTDRPEVHCRVLTTSTLELLTIGHTIVLSRGLIDVLPDEGTLAAMLAQEMADIWDPKPAVDEYGFSDILRVSTVEALRRLTFKDNPEDVKAASDQALQLLWNSPYKDKLGQSGLFLKELSVESKSLKALINPSLGDKVYLASRLTESAPELHPEKLDQIAALPLGSRVKLDPWTDRVEMLKATNVSLVSKREKMPFEITAFMPYLTRYKKSPDSKASDSAALMGKSIPPVHAN